MKKSMNADSERQSPSSSEHLPNRLYSGDVVQTKSGHRAEIVVTSERDSFDQPLYRLRHIDGIVKGTVGGLLVSRDDMDKDGLVLVKKGREE